MELSGSRLHELSVVTPVANPAQFDLGYCVMVNVAPIHQTTLTKYQGEKDRHVVDSILTRAKTTCACVYRALICAGGVETRIHCVWKKMAIWNQPNDSIAMTTFNFALTKFIQIAFA